jgi:hypothetical protein
MQLDEDEAPAEPARPRAKRRAASHPLAGLELDEEAEVSPAPESRPAGIETDVEIDEEIAETLAALPTPRPARSRRPDAEAPQVHRSQSKASTLTRVDKGRTTLETFTIPLSGQSRSELGDP